MSAFLTIPWFKPDPVLVPLGKLVGSSFVFELHWFGICAFAAILFGSLMGGLYYAKRVGISRDDVWDMIFWCVLFGFIGAHVFSVVVYHPKDFFADPIGALKSRGAMSSFGGYLAGTFGAFWWARKRPGKLLPVGDAVVFSCAFAWIVARIGCFLAHDHPGSPSSFFLAVANYETGEPPYVSRHDLGLYDAIVWVVISAVLLVVTRKPRPSGFVAALVPILYCPARFVLDYFRAPEAQGGDIRYFGLTPGQYMALGFLLVACVFWYRRLSMKAQFGASS